MGSGKKKDKKKKKRQRSSSDDDNYDNYDHLEKYSSKRKSDTYVVEDVRPKPLQAIADNYSYEKTEKKKRSKYDDVPETEEYIYDQFGQQIVQTSRDMSLSPESSDDEYDYKTKSSKDKEIYEKNINQSNYSKRKGPVTPPPPSSPPPKPEKYKKGIYEQNISVSNYSKGKRETNTVKSQIKSSIVNSDVSSSYHRKKDLLDNSSEYTKKKETKDQIDYVSASYTHSKALKEETNYVSSAYSQKKVIPPSKSENKVKATSPPNSQIKSSISNLDSVSSDYSQKRVPPHSSKSGKHKKPTYEEDISESNYIKGKQEASPLKSQIKSSIYSDYVSSDYSQKNLPTPPPPPLSPPLQSPPPPPPKLEKNKKATYEQDISVSNYSKGKQETSSLKSQIKSSMSNSDYVSSEYSPKKDLYDNSSEYTIKRESKDQTDYPSANYTQSKASKEETNFVSSDYSQKNISTHYDESEKKTIDYNSADYILKKIREQTKFKPSNNQTKESKSDYTLSSYLQKNELMVQPDYLSSNYTEKGLTDPNCVTSTYNEKKLPKEQSEYIAKHSLRESSDYDSNYVQKRDVRELPDYVSNDAAMSGYSYNNDSVKKANVSLDYTYEKDSVQESDFNSSGYAYQNDLYEETDYKSSDFNPKKDSVKQYDYDSSDYNEDANKQIGYASNHNVQRKDLNMQAEYASSECSYKRDSNNLDDYVSRDYIQGRDSREGVEYGSNDYVQKSRERSLSPLSTIPSVKQCERKREITPPPLRKREITPPPLRKREITPPPLKPGVDWPYEVSTMATEPSTYNDYHGWQKEDEDKQPKYYEEQIEKKIEKTRDYPARQKIELVKNELQPPTSSSDSLSIEETNKLRAKLGLKPLKVDSGSSGTQEKSYADREDVHQPASNISEKKSEEKMREKMEAIREKRKINKKLQKVKGLGEEDDPVLDSAAAWVAKSRLHEKEKAMADKREQMLEEMDEEFGVTKIMSKSILKKSSKYDEYSSRNLQGLKVEHRGSELVAGENIILTLKDKDILDDDDEDVLYNINVRESEQAKSNLRNKNKRPGYQAYEEFDEETGEFKMKTILNKYDEEIQGEKRDSFRIDADGTADLEGENHINKIRAILKSQQVSLATEVPQQARDYFTSEEMVSFKKPGKKKVRKVRKREVLKADDLLKMDIVDSQRDRGSRKLKSALKNSSKVAEEDTSMDMDIVPTGPDELDYFVAVNQHLEEDEPLVGDDEAEQELQLALQRSRRASQKNFKKIGDENSILERMAKEVLNKQQVKDEAEVVNAKLKKKAKGAIVLDSTSEFCRTLGDQPNFALNQFNETEHKSDDDMDIEEPATTTAATTASGWEQVEIVEGPKVADTKEEDDDVLEAEPIPTGLAATLNLANMKGYLKDGKEKVRKFDPLNLPETKAEVDIEKLRDEEKNKYSRGYERERDRGDRYDPYAWKEKLNYKPDIKLEYVDNKGRQMNQKEAFRLLSHKFHGKGSGKLKTEKRSKKLLDEKKLQMMSSIDTPLNTAALFKDKQKQSQSAYLVLSGGGKNILSGETLKK